MEHNSRIKLCYMCNTIKCFDDFNNDFWGKYGLSSKCKICSSKTFKEYYKNNKQKFDDKIKKKVTCEECLGQYKKSNKTNHEKTNKHKQKKKEIEDNIYNLII
jgi:hypothetical protein